MGDRRPAHLPTFRFQWMATAKSTLQRHPELGSPACLVHEQWRRAECKAPASSPLSWAVLRNEVARPPSARPWRQTAAFAPMQLVQHQQHLRRVTSGSSCPVHKHRRHRGRQTGHPPTRRCGAVPVAAAWAPIGRQRVAHGRKLRAVGESSSLRSTWGEPHQLWRGPAHPAAGQQTQRRRVSVPSKPQKVEHRRGQSCG